ncbi:polysaccharide deacetylase family protein [Arabiibacter massiliensis]|uniref:polysaccharide deacetylase family protein n=1 Tax=Arabiibacter massiliensis TaxID=1870985 RepID=UPI001E35B74B|nr:polysaccharide deacetylase family protein [Arabiibacter massiliensis]
MPYGSRPRTAPPQPKRPRRKLAGILVCSAIVLAFASVIAFAVQSLPISITFNGQALEVPGERTLADAIKTSGIQPAPGDLVAVDGSVIEAGKGEPFHATVNGEPASDLTRKLAKGDVVEVGDGGPIEEPSDVSEQAVPFVIETEGNGAIHLLEGEGAEGLVQTKTGHISGITADQTVREPQNITRRNVSPQVGDDKVIALTFDDGPWPDTTAQVLDVLKEHGAKATFFTVGNRIDGEGIDLVKRAAAEGHQICTHSFSHASGTGQGVNLGYMSPEEQTAEIEQGYAAIQNATGAEASRVIRTPGGNYGEEVMRAIGPLISVEIGWNIDSQDWQKPGAGAIVNQIEAAWPGAIVLMHDGGGDRTQTVEALRKALPRLKEQGYRFVTVDELMAYPLA